MNKVKHFESIMAELEDGRIVDVEGEARFSTEVFEFWGRTIEEEEIKLSITRVIDSETEEVLNISYKDEDFLLENMSYDILEEE